MGKIMRKGPLPPDDPLFKEGCTVSLVWRPESIDSAKVSALAGRKGRRAKTPPSKEGRRWRWAERPVDPAKEHFVLRYGPASHPSQLVAVARVGPPVDGVVAVEWLIDRSATASEEMAKAVATSLDFYLLDVGGPNPWAYAGYHCTTAANLYDPVHWTHHVPPDKDSAAGA
jgi:hypothetical protein